MKNAHRLRLFWHAVTGNKNARSVLRWKLLRADHLLYKHVLHPNALVYDVGGYKGDWTWAMREKYSCEFHVFEPHPEFFEHISTRFSGLGGIILHEVALGGESGSVSLSSAAEGSSIITGRGLDAVEVKLVDVCQHLRDDGRPVALLKLNIEGAEYDLLERLLWSDESVLAGDFLVQFHPGPPFAEQRYAQIARKLSETHRCVWRYAFLWELWRRIQR
jgi:FkbM family methyltransferase